MGIGRNKIQTLEALWFSRGAAQMVLASTPDGKPERAEACRIAIRSCNHAVKYINSHPLSEKQTFETIEKINRFGNEFFQCQTGTLKLISFSIALLSEAITAFQKTKVKKKYERRQKGKLWFLRHTLSEFEAIYKAVASEAPDIDYHEHENEEALAAFLGYQEMADDGNDRVVGGTAHSGAVSGLGTKETMQDIPG